LFTVVIESSTTFFIFFLMLKNESTLTITIASTMKRNVGKPEL
jgi:hypothetical protein